MTLPPGTSLGPYEILARVGEDRMGVVHRAKFAVFYAAKPVPAA